MKPEGLGFMAALPQECRSVLRWKGWRCVRAKPYPRVWERPHGRRWIRLVISGMGGERARNALEELLGPFSARRVVCFGFGGALEKTLGLGELVWGRRVLRWREDETVEVGPELDLGFAPSGLGATGGSGGREGFLVSVDRFVPKDRVRRRLEPRWSPAVLEMETFAVREAIGAAGVPLSAVRAVSDEWDLEPSGKVDGWVDETLELRASLLIRDLTLHPGRIRFLWKMMRGSQAAARSLERAVRGIVAAWEPR